MEDWKSNARKKDNRGKLKRKQEILENLQGKKEAI